jgi:hypothetical protein
LRGGWSARRLIRAAKPRLPGGSGAGTLRPPNFHQVLDAGGLGVEPFFEF